MGENLADFLNENAGVMGAAANRNIAATNRSISALRDDLGKLHEQLAQDKETEKRELLNRDVLFRFSQRVKALSSGPASPEVYFELVRVSEDFRQLGFDSGTFSTLQDKSFLSEVLSAIDQSFATVWESFSDELKEQIAEVSDWNSLKDLGVAIAIADQKIPSIKKALSAALKEGEVLRKEKPSVFSDRIWNAFMFGPLLICAFSIFWLASGDSNKPSLTAILLMLFSPLFAFFAWLARLPAVDKSVERHTAETTEYIKRAKNLREQLSFLVSNRPVFVQRLNELQRIPVDTINFFASEIVTPQERLTQLNQVSAYVADICARISLHPARLPSAPERQQKHGLLLKRA